MKLEEINEMFKDPEFRNSWDEMYSRWIAINYPTIEDAIGQCYQATLKMQKKYPWLIRVRGIAHTLHGEALHWWLECPLIDKIVDPTEKQFTLISYYEKLPDNDVRCKYPRKKCMNCGCEFFSDKFACSVKCDKELEEAFN
jgi:hypothetical protein